MTQLKVKNVGPIKNGYKSADGFMSFNGVTVFIGNQGSGKSTVAKLFSTLSWIEKSLVQGEITKKQINENIRFREEYLAYQGIDGYLNADSYIEYVGKMYRLKYENKKFTVTGLDNSAIADYPPPKIMYVPAERNLIEAVGSLRKVKNLPRPFYDFYNEYENAREAMKELKLPIDNTRIIFDKKTNSSVLIGKDFAIDLSKASSGYHSLVPLMAVTAYLSGIVKRGGSRSKHPLSREMKKRVNQEIQKLIIHKEIPGSLLEAVHSIIAKYHYKSFINVVEEPELNLYPTSQQAMLFELLKYRNEKEHNKLVITTHSPYIISYLTLAIQAQELLVADKLTAKNKKKLESLVPSASAIASDEVAIYEMDGKTGTISALEKYNGLPSDENSLNQRLDDSNHTFAELLEMEDDAN